MAKQLNLYEQIENPGSRQVWRESEITKSFRSSYKVDIKKIEVLSGWNARTIFEGIEELADDIYMNGLLEPISGFLSKDGKKFHIIDGERRFRAIQELIKRGIEINEVEVIPTPTNIKAEDLLARMLSSGIHKSMYKDVEIADCLYRMKQDFSLSNEAIAAKIGKSRQYVDNMIKLAKQPDEVKEEVASGKRKKTTVIIPQKDNPTEVVAGMIKPSPQPGLPPSLKTDNTKAENESGDISNDKKDPSPAANDNAAPAPTSVSGKDALQGINFDKEINEQEGQINTIWKQLNKIEALGKGLNEQAKEDMDKYLSNIRYNLTQLKEFYSKQKNRIVV